MTWVDYTLKAPGTLASWIAIGFALSMPLCFVFLRRKTASVLLEKAQDSFVLATWLLSRSKLRVCNSSMILAKTRNRYYESQKFGAALAIDIVRSVVVRFMFGFSDLFSTIILSVVSQVSEGYWAELSLLNDDSELEEEATNADDSVLKTTVNGFVSTFAHIPVSTQGDLLEDVGALETGVPVCTSER